MTKLRDDRDLLTTELLQKYRNGTLSPEEEIRVEALRNQDLFIADALEGVARTSDGESFATDVASLRARLRKKTQKGRSLPVYTLRVAASLVVLLLASYLVYDYVWPDQLIPIVKEEAVPAPSATSQFVPQHSSPSRVVSLPPETLADLESTKKVEKLSSLALVQPPLISSELSPQADEALISLTETEASDEEFTRAEPLPEIAVKREIAVAPRSKIRTAVSNSSTVSGQVLDEEEGTPIPGVNVIIEGTQQGALTDLDGNYRIELPEDQATLVFSFIGYLAEEAPVVPGQTLDITLEPDVQSLSEVVVTGYGSSAKKDNTATVTSAQPRQGMRAYKKYLRDNIRYPDDWQVDDKDRSANQTVKVSFSVQPDGSLTDFTVKRSAGTRYDQEAIRLIREGPDWKAATQNNQPVAQQITLRVRFKRQTF